MQNVGIPLGYMFILLRYNERFFFSDSFGLHKVENKSKTQQLVSLHVYSPPIRECQVRQS